MNRLLLLLLLCLSLGCGTVHSIRPLEAGRTEISVDLGGPAIGQINAPVPMLDLGVRHGIDGRSDVWVQFHLLPLVFKPAITGLDVGLSRLLVQQDGAKPALTVAGALSVFASKDGGYAHLNVPLTVSWLVLQDRWLHYIGVYGTVFLTGFQVLDLPPVAASPYIGTEIRIGPNKAFGIGGQITWYEPYISTQRSVIAWTGIGGQGALGFQLRLRFAPQPKRGKKNKPPPPPSGEPEAPPQPPTEGSNS